MNERILIQKEKDEELLRQRWWHSAPQKMQLSLTKSQIPFFTEADRLRYISILDKKEEKRK